MPAGVLIIAIGLMAIYWGGWWVPRQLRQMGERVPPQGRERYDRLMIPVMMQRMRRLSVIVGSIGVLIGVVYLILEL
jgi:hypothetical protein